MGARYNRIIPSGFRKQKFDSKVFREYCASLKITNRYSSSAYLQSNAQAEVMNKTIVNGLKKRLEGVKGNWVEEFPNVLWAYQTTPRRSAGETPFSMTNEAEAVILVKVGNLDALEEQRDMVAVRFSDYQQRLAQGYDIRAKRWEFVPGDLFLRKAIGSAKDQSVGKLAPDWEGPYQVTTTAGMRAYYLEDLEEKPLP
ncbi:uncharacterized protein LOC142612178 [Castanea sativa]|uniref:uncharacterized protein LOC142612178 n=1 Tax=Castanea sativa TaxID=21020 RepID=UPI003F651571